MSTEYYWTDNDGLRYRVAHRSSRGAGKGTRLMVQGVYLNDDEIVVSEYGDKIAIGELISQSVEVEFRPGVELDDA